MKTFFTIILSSFLLATSCSKEETPDIQTDDNGVIVSLPYQWKKSLHNNGVVSNSFIRKPIYYNGNIAIPTTNGGNNRRMSLINPDNGETLWSWDDRYQPETEDIFIDYYHQNNNLLTYQIGDRNYCIDMDTGMTQWKYRRELSFLSRISGLENTYFSFGETESMYPEYQEKVVYKGNINTGEIEEYIIPDFTLEHIIANRIGMVTHAEPYYKDGIQYLVITWQELTDDTIWNFQTYLGLYNYDTNEWVYEKKVMNEPNLNGVVLAPPVIYQDKFYTNIGHQLFCHDIMSGNQVWVRDFPQDFMFSGFIIVEDKIIANNEDTYTYCLNPDTGGIIWKTETAGTSGRMSYLNGIVYFVGGSTGRLHAIDINTGKHVWKLDAELIGEPDNSNFKTNAIYVFPAEGDKPARIVALSHLYAYCFEAYQ